MRDFVFTRGCVEEGSGNELLPPWSIYRELEERVQGGPWRRIISLSVGVL
jgi:hypothetical protein